MVNAKATHNFSRGTIKNTHTHTHTHIISLPEHKSLPNSSLKDKLKY